MFNGKPVRTTCASVYVTFHHQIELILWNNLAKYCSWSLVFYGSKNWALRKVDQIYVENFLVVVMGKDGEDQLDRSTEE
jgi:hypothetical protein